MGYTLYLFLQDLFLHLFAIAVVVVGTAFMSLLTGGIAVCSLVVVKLLINGFCVFIHHPFRFPLTDNWTVGEKRVATIVGAVCFVYSCLFVVYSPGMERTRYILTGQHYHG